MAKKPAKKTKKPAAGNNQVFADQYTIVDRPPSICPFCRSDKRDPYHGTQTLPGPVRIGGTVYAKVELRRTRCVDCNRRRIDRTLVPLIPKPPEPGDIRAATAAND